MEEQAVARRLGELFATGRARPRAPSHCVRVPGAGPVSAECRHAESAGRPAPVHRRRDVHLDRAYRVRLVRGRLREGRGGGSLERRGRPAARGGARVPHGRDHGRGGGGARCRGSFAAKRRRAGSRRRSCSRISRAPRHLVEALGDEAWQGILRWHDETLRALFVEHAGEEVVATGDGFFVGFDSPDQALACAVAIQRRLAEHRRRNGFAPKVRIGVHASGATQVGRISPARGCTRRRASPRSRAANESWRAATPLQGRASRCRNRAR